MPELYELNPEELKDFQDLEDLAKQQQDLPEAKAESLRLYNKFLKEISKVLEILADFDAFKAVNVFQECKSKEWQIKFINNFYKLFVDRERCQDHQDFYENYTQFNNSATEQTETTNNCYAETFAFAFLIMLKNVLKVYQEEQQVQAQNPEFSIKLFFELNRILMRKKVSDLHEAEPQTKITSCGAIIAIEEVAEIHKMQRCQNVQTSFLYHGTLGFSIISFEEGYPHVELLNKFLQKYFQERQEVADDDSKKRDELAAKLVNYLGSYVHPCSDANGRSAFLSSWFLSLTDKVPMLQPVLANNYFPSATLAFCGSRFVQTFFQDPEIEVFSQEERDIFGLEFQRVKEEYAKAKPVEFCLEQLMTCAFNKEKDSQLSFTHPIANQLCLVKSEIDDRDFIIFGYDFVEEANSFVPIDLRFMRQAFELNSDKILAQKTPENIRDLMISSYIEFALNNKDKMKQEDLFLMQIVYNYCAIENKELVVKIKANFNVKEGVFEFSEFLPENSNIQLSEKDVLLTKSELKTANH